MKKLIKCGKLYDGVQNSIQSNMEILIDGKVIESVGHNLPVPNGTEIIDLSDCTVTPGMIDAHVHSQYETGILATTILCIVGRHGKLCVIYMWHGNVCIAVLPRFVALVTLLMKPAAALLLVK